MGHVEAGLRTGDFQHPFPEEMNRRVVDLVSDANFVPTRRAARALERRGRPGRPDLPDRQHGRRRARSRSRAARGTLAEEDLVLITAHRRESFGEPLERVVRAIGRLAGAFPATRFVHVIHPNPNVAARRPPQRGPFRTSTLVEPLDYLALVRLMRRARLILTDSGGIQEEAPTFGKPVLVLREKTERPEGVEAGLAGSSEPTRRRSSREASTLLADGAARRRWPAGPIPTATASPPSGSRRSCCGRPFAPFVPPA